ncbi:MAG: hypothetical protein GX345_05735 [Clostridiales bacterium]|nr:hypothetical protein [Clostridiales bacterium]
MAKKCDCGKFPTIVVPGIGNCRAFLEDEQGKRIKRAWPPEISDQDFKALKKSLTLPALRMMVFRKDLGFSKKVKDELTKLLDFMASDADGKYRHNVRLEVFENSLAACNEKEKKFIYGMLPFCPLAEAIGEDHLYYFSFVAIGNTQETIDRLRAFIKKVKEETGHDRVNLASVSLGASVTTAYLDQYASDKDINRVVGVVPAFDGSLVISDILKGNIDFDNYESLFQELMGRSTAQKIMKIVRLVPPKVMKSFILALVGAVIDTAIRNSTTFWGVVPASDYKQLSDKLLSDPSHAKIKAEADRWHAIKSNFSALVEKARENGIEIFSLGGYNLRLFSAVKTGNVHSDMIVHTASETMGGNFAPLGQAFEDSYEQSGLCCKEADHNHMSPHRDIDLSASPLADTAWLWRNMGHEDGIGCQQFLNLMRILLTDNSLKDVFQDPEFPQFNEFVKDKK